MTHTNSKTDNSDLRNKKCLDHQFSIFFTKNLIKLQESLNSPVENKNDLELDFKGFFLHGFLLFRHCT